MSSFDPLPERGRADLTAQEISDLAGVLRERRGACAGQLAARQPSGGAAPKLDPATRDRTLAVARAELEQVAAALARIQDGTFGWCTRCLAPIAAERLHAAPHVAHCLPCAMS